MEETRSSDENNNGPQQPSTKKPRKDPEEVGSSAFDSLPIELTQTIIQAVDVTSVAVCRLVCKQWRLWFLERKPPKKEQLCARLALLGRLTVLRWVRENGCPWDAFACSGAARGGHLSALQWARANGCPWDTETCAQAAAGGHLSVLQWARANGCPWSQETCAMAGGRHLSMLQWARANGCPCCARYPKSESKVFKVKAFTITLEFPLAIVMGGSYSLCCRICIVCLHPKDSVVLW